MNEEKIRNQPLTACKRHSPAAGGQERALEAISVDGKTIENGAFTYSILECLKQNEGKELKVNTLKQYAEKRVDGSGLGGEVEVLYLHTMKKQLFFLLFLFVSTLSLAQSSLDSLRLVLPEGHTTGINTALFSPDGNIVLTASGDHTAKLWDSKSGQLLQSIEVHTSDVSSAVFNAKATEILTASGSSAKIWDVKSGKLLLNLSRFAGIHSPAHEENLKLVEYSPDGRTILTASEDGTAKLWNAQSGQLLLSLEGHIDVVRENDQGIPALFTAFTAKFSPDGETILTTCGRTVRIWDAESGRLLQSVEAHTGDVSSAVFSPDGRTILTASKDMTAKLWDAQSGQLLHSLEGHTNYVRSAVFSPDGSIVLTASWDNTAKLWDSKSSALLHSLEGHKDVVWTAEFSPDGGTVLTSSWDNTARIWDAKSGELLQNLEGHKDIVRSAVFSSDGSIALTASRDHTAKLWDVKSGRLLQSLEGYTIGVSTAVFSPDGTTLLIATLDSSIRIWDTESGKLLQHLVGDFSSIKIAVFSPDGTALLTTGDSIVRLWDTKSGKLLQHLVGHFSSVKFAVFSPDGTTVLTSGDNAAKLWNVKSGRLLRNFENYYLLKAVFSSDGKTIITHGLIYSELWDAELGELLRQIKTNIDNPLYSAEFSLNEKLLFSGTSQKVKTFKLLDTKSGKQLKVLKVTSYVKRGTLSPNEKYVLTTGFDHKTILWDLASGRPFYERIQLENNNWLVKLPNSPYYMCSKDASKMLHYVTPSLKVIGFEQLDPVYNRPDIVLDSIGKYFGGADQELVANYRQSWEKRIDRLGLDKEKLGKGEIAVPNAEIEGADAIAYENKAGKLNIKVSANDPKYPLRRFNVFVNEVPLYGSAGVSIAHLKKQVWDTTVSVPLSVGENKIQVSVMNELGLENFKYPTYVNYTPTKEIVAKTHYIGIGVNEFKESSHNLKYCVKDVRDLAKAFTKENINCDTLLFIDKQVTKENILALKDYLNKTGVNDKVIISCSSHGLLDDSLNFYLAMHDVDFNNPKARGLKYEALESLLDGIPARQKLLLLDACNSGENDKTEVLKKDLAQADKQKETPELAEYKNKTKGVIIKLEEENKSNFKKMNELFVNVRNNTGSVIISAAGGQESALEAISVDGKTIENGAFTYSILECLKQNEGKELKVNALKQYAEKRVEEITNGKQKPTSRQETMEVDWGVR